MRNLSRLAAPALALCLAGPALADSKGGGGNTAMADCVRQADIAWAQALGMCPTGPDYMLQACLGKAAQDHALALIGCERETSAAIIGGTRNSIPTGGLRTAAPRTSRIMPEIAGPSSRFSMDGPASKGPGSHLGRR